MTPPTHSGAEDSVRLLLTKISLAPSVTPGERSTVFRLNGSCGPGRQLARYQTPPMLLTLA